MCAAAFDGSDIDIIFANDTFYSMFGYTKEQFNSELESPLEPIHPDDRPKIMEGVAALVKNGGSITSEYRCVKRDGSIINVYCNNTVTAFEGIEKPVLLSVTQTQRVFRRVDKGKAGGRAA